MLPKVGPVPSPLIALSASEVLCASSSSPAGLKMCWVDCSLQATHISLKTGSCLRMQVTGAGIGCLDKDTKEACISGILMRLISSVL